MANPRKFSEKIALQKQKQAEGTAEFEKIMNEVKATRVVDNAQGNTDLNDGNGLQRNASLSGGSGGSGTSSGASGGGASPDTNAGGGGVSMGGGGGVGILNSSTGSRESRVRSVGVGPMRRPSERKQDRSPYGSTASGLMLSGMPQQTQNSYLSPPMDSSWRRSNSDSALHQTLNNLAEGNFATSTSPVPSLIGDLNSLHANLHHHHHSQRSQSPNIVRSYSPQAQRRKNTLLQQQQQQHQQQIHHQQQQQQLQHQRLQMQQQQEAQQHQQLQQHLQNQQQCMQQHQLHHQQQQQQYANAKYNNSNIMFKSIHEQQLAFNNTGSLPDLTSVHYSTTNPNNNSPQMMQTTTQQQQQALSPILSPHHNNVCHDRDQSSSPFSPASTTGGGGPPSPYHQQQHSPTSATNTPSANVQTSPHLSFTNLSVQSPVNVQQTTAQNTAAAFSTLPTLGATSSTGNLTDYRQPLNPPSPGSSPGLLASGPANDIHTSAPPSPIRHCQNNLNTSVSGGNNSQNQQTQMPAQSLQNSFGNLESNPGYNTLNSAFHNHFEQFHLGDSSQSPQNNYDALEFEDLGMGNQQHNNFNSKIIDFSDLTTPSSATSSHTTRTNSTNTTSSSNNNNNLPQQQRNNSQQFQHHHQQLLLNNNSATTTTSSNTNTNGPSNTCRTHHTGLMNNNERQQDILSGNSSPIPSPLSNCVPPPSSPLPIPISTHSPAHHQQLSLSVQTSPHQSPMHSPHHSPSPLSVSSPGLTMLGGSISPAPSPSAHIMQQHQHNHLNNQTANQLHHNQTSHNNHHLQQHQQQHNQTHTSTAATNIPQIIFSDYSSSRDIFDSLDLDLGTIDGPGLQMLSDQNPIMIADPSIEDSFRRDLN